MYLPKTAPGTMFLPNFLFQTVLSGWAATSYTFFDVLFTIQVIHVSLLANILREKIKALRRIAAIRKPNRMEIVVNLKNIFKCHKEMLT